MKCLITLFLISLVGHSLCSTCISPKELILFFDGNSSPNTEPILQTLEKHNTTATFFVNSTILLQGSSQITNEFQRIKDRGHVLGLTFDLSASEMQQETDALRGTVENIVRLFQGSFGVIPRIIKTPANAEDSFNSFMDGYGFVRPKISVDISKVWSENCPVVFNNFISQKSGDSIILNLADTPYTCAVPYLKNILATAKENMYSLQNIVECLNLPGPYREMRTDGPSSFNLFDPFSEPSSSSVSSQFKQAKASESPTVQPLISLTLLCFLLFVII